jgi:hypothetical protein
MDLLDLMRLMVRRWYVAVPIVVFAAIGALVVGNSTKPEYQAEVSIVLVPPKTEPAEAQEGKAPPPRNPWLQIGTTAMAQAIQIAVSSGEARAAVTAAGGDGGGYEAGVVTRTAIVSVEVATSSEAATRATVKAVSDFVAQEVAARQAPHKPRPGEEITTEILDDGSSVGISKSNVLRAQVVVGVLGFLMAAAFSVIVDAVLRRRAQSRLALRADGRAAGSAGAPGALAAPARQAAAPARQVRVPNSRAADADLQTEPKMAAERDGQAAAGQAVNGDVESTQHITPMFVRGSNDVDDTIMITPFRPPRDKK